MSELQAWIDDLITKIEAHDKYGPAMRRAADSGRKIVLNYHTHGPGQDYCVSILAESVSGLKVLGQEPRREELAHVRGIGRTEEEGRELMTALGEGLKARYGLAQVPAYLVNSRPPLR